MTSSDDQVATGGDDRAVTGDDQAELARLRAEVAELQAHRRGGWGRRGRWLAAIVLAVLAALLTPAALVARYARAELLDTDRYVATVAPLAEDPAVQASVTDEVTGAVIGFVDPEDRAAEALEALVEQGAPELIVGLATPIAAQVESFVHDQVGSYVTSDSFAELWVRANRTAHGEVQALLTGDRDGAIQSEDGVISLDLGLIVAAVKERLIDRGFDLAERIPDDVDRQLTIAETDAIDRAQAGVRLLDRTATFLPFVVVAVGAAAVLVAPDRRRALVIVAAGITLTMVLLAAALALARNWYVANGTPERLSKEAALSIAHTLLVPFRTMLRVVLVLGVTLTLAAYLAGPSGTAAAIRGGVTRGIAAVRRRAAGDRAPSAAEAWVARYKTPLRVGAVGVGALVFALWTYPSGAVVITIAMLVLVAIVVIELVARPAPG